MDFLPTDERILGFSNRWYSEAIRRREEVILPSGMKIFIMPISYFIATKIEAFLDRGHGDFRTSKDFEDLVSVFNGSEQIELRIKKASKNARDYISKSFKLFMAKDSFLEGIEAHLAPSERTRKDWIKQRILAILNK